MEPRKREVPVTLTRKAIKEIKETRKKFLRPLNQSTIMQLKKGKMQRELSNGFPNGNEPAKETHLKIGATKQRQMIKKRFILKWLGPEVSDQMSAREELYNLFSSGMVVDHLRLYYYKLQEMQARCYSLTTHINTMITRAETQEQKVALYGIGKKMEQYLYHSKNYIEPTTTALLNHFLDAYRTISVNINNGILGEKQRNYVNKLKSPSGSVSQADAVHRVLTVENKLFEQEKRHFLNKLSSLMNIIYQKNEHFVHVDKTKLIESCSLVSKSDKESMAWLSQVPVVSANGLVQIGTIIKLMGQLYDPELDSASLTKQFERVSNAVEENNQRMKAIMSEIALLHNPSNSSQTTLSAEQKEALWIHCVSSELPAQTDFEKDLNVSFEKNAQLERIESWNEEIESIQKNVPVDPLDEKKNEFSNAASNSKEVTFSDKTEYAGSESAGSDSEYEKTGCKKEIDLANCMEEGNRQIVVNNSNYKSASHVFHTKTKKFNQ